MHYAFLAGLMLLFGFLSISNFESAIADNQSSHVQYVAGHLRAYGSYVSAYARSNPGASGVVGDAAIGYPAWLSRPTGMKGYVSGGKAYMYYMPETVAQANSIASSCGGGLMCGVTRSSSLFVPGTSTASVTSLPTVIPANGALVLIM